MITKLLTCEWMKQLYKLADFIALIPACLSCWGAETCKLQMITIVFHFLSHSPWELQSTPKIFAVVRKVLLMIQKLDMATRDFCVNVYWMLGVTLLVKRWCGHGYTSNQKLNFCVKTLQDTLDVGRNGSTEVGRLNLAWKKKQ